MRIYSCILAGLLGGLTLSASAVEPLYVVMTPENALHQTPVISVTGSEILGRMTAEHPRLILTKGRIAELRKLAATDTVLQGYIASVLKQAEGLLRSEVTERERECQNRVLTLGFAYHWTGEAKFSVPAIRDLLALCAKRDWDWNHFLTTGEHAQVVGLGYDWFRDAMDAATRETIEQRLITLGLIPGIAAYHGAPYGWFHQVRHNWNQVCNSGLIIGALAIADTYPEYARLIVPRALSSLALAQNEYALDGAYPEGPGYNGFGTGGAIFGLASLATALGTDYGLSAIPGFSQNYYYRIYGRGPSGLGMGYADSAPKPPRYADAGNLWMARRFSDPFLAADEHEFLKKSGRAPSALHVIHYVPGPSAPPAELPLDRYFNGPVEFASLRGSWTDRNAAFVGVKAGYSQVNHGHLDLGNFEIDLLGERWFYDIGGDSYSLKDYFKMDSTRWTYYRNSSRSHNVPLLDGANQDIRAVTRFARRQLNVAEPFVSVDLSSAYPGTCTKVERGVKLVEGRRGILIQDEFELTGPHTITWGVMTDAEIVLRGAEAELTQKGKKIRVTILTPGTTFQEVSTRQEPPQKTNEGIRRLAFEVKAPAGRQVLAVLVVPAAAAAPAARPITRLSAW